MFLLLFCPRTPSTPSCRRKHSRAAFSTTLGLGWVGVKRASSWSWGPQRSAVLAGHRQREVLGGDLDLEPKVCLGQEVPPKPPAGADQSRAQPAQVLQVLAGKWLHLALEGVPEETTAGTWVLIPCHTLTPLVNSLLLLWSSRVSLFPVHFSVWLGYGPGPSTLTPRV